MTQSILDQVVYSFAVFHGEADTEIPVTGSQKLMALAKTPAQDKQLKTYPGARHRLLEDPSSVTIGQDMVQWLDARAKLGLPLRPAK